MPFTLTIGTSFRELGQKPHDAPESCQKYYSRLVVVEMSGVVLGDAHRVWAAWKPKYPLRPRSEESRNLDIYPLAFGISVPVVLVELNPMRDWTVEHSLPAGRLVIKHWMLNRGERQVVIGKRFEVSGPLTPLYALVLLPAIRRDWPRQLKLLESRARS